jgi:hypothetical protein
MCFYDLTCFGANERSRGGEGQSAIDECKCIYHDASHISPERLKEIVEECGERRGSDEEAAEQTKGDEELEGDFH